MRADCHRTRILSIKDTPYSSKAWCSYMAGQESSMQNPPEPSVVQLII